VPEFLYLSLRFVRFSDNHVSQMARSASTIHFPHTPVQMLSDNAEKITWCLTVLQRMCCGWWKRTSSKRNGEQTKTDGALHLLAC